MLADVGLLRTKIFYPDMMKRGADQYLQTKKFVEAMQEKTAVLVALAPQDGEERTMVGSADLLIEQVPGAGGQWCTLAYIANVCVLPEARRQGLGRKLVVLAEERSVAAGASAIVLHVDDSNEPARLLYERMGFVHETTPQVVAHFMGERYVESTTPSQQLLSKSLHGATPAARPPVPPGYVPHPGYLQQPAYPQQPAPVERRGQSGWTPPPNFGRA